MISMLAILLLLLLVHVVSGQQTGDLVGELDSLVQDYAFRAFYRPRTGTIYQAQPPSNLTGIQISALRLRRGSLWRRGFSGYHEFNIPTGVVVHPYVERVALVYFNLGNWSSYYYHLSPGYRFLAPVIALLAYDASNLSAVNLPLLEIRVSNPPISITFSDLVQSPSSICAFFSFNGSVELSPVVNQTSCFTTNQGHFSIITNSSLPSPPPPPPPPPPPAHHAGTHRRLWIIIGSVAGGVALLILLAIFIALLTGCLRRKKIRGMEAAAEGGVPLQMTNVGQMKAPVAAETRTKPAIETELVP